MGIDGCQKIMTGFNEEDLLKIEKATSGFFKGNARSLIATALRELQPKIEAAKRLKGAARFEALKRLVNEATALRHRALSRGANSHGSGEWAAAAACESWLHSLMIEEAQDIARVESVVARLMKRV